MGTPFYLENKRINTLLRTFIYYDLIPPQQSHEIVIYHDTNFTGRESLKLLLYQKSHS